ncbi:hypothetical protein TNCV_3472101 [Trichonephila clavipes]|nr:hypothetical protein TNCV_3472101 [Trichonephila clavipes]
MQRALEQRPVQFIIVKNQPCPIRTSEDANCVRDRNKKCPQIHQNRTEQIRTEEEILSKDVMIRPKSLPPFLMSCGYW